MKRLLLCPAMFLIVLTAHAQALLANSQTSDIAPEIRAVMDSLKKGLAESGSKYPELADANSIQIAGSLSGTPLYGFDYFHHCIDSGKLGYEETGPNPIHIGFRITTLPPKGHGFAFECTPPTRIWRNLNLAGWTRLYPGQNPSPGLEDKLKKLLDQATHEMAVLDCYGLPPDLIWTGLPSDWGRDELWRHLVDHFKIHAKKDFPECEMRFSDLSTHDDNVIKDGQLHLSYRTHEYVVQRPTGKHINAKLFTRKETGPQKDGFIMRIWLSDQIGQLKRPQLLDRTYWKLYATELYLPDIKMFLYANIEYGSQTDKDVVSKYTNLKGWLESVMKDKEEKTTSD